MSAIAWAAGTAELRESGSALMDKKICEISPN
jgi:hypothetical protein